MIYKTFLIIFFILGFSKFVQSNEITCHEFKKFSANYIKCKASLLKDKTISAGKDFVEDTKEYQKKEWSEEKKKLIKLKKKF